LQYEEALDVLGLKPGATAVEIKETYRDLVKVWHPDRFGSDARLRLKAEEKLQQINNAYRLLQSAPARELRMSRRCGVRAYSEPPSAPRKYSARSGKMIAGWFLGGLGIVAIVVVAIFALTHDWSQTQAPVAPETQPQPQSASSAESHAGASKQMVPRRPLKNMTHVDDAMGQFQVRQLSDAEAKQLESVCPKAMELHDAAAYHACVQDQLGVSSPDMSALSAEDRNGIESACMKTKTREGMPAYNR